MGHVVNLGHGTHLSISSLANELGMQRETVRKRLADAKIKPSGKRSGYPVFRLKDVLTALMGAADGELDPDTLEPFKRHAYYKGEHEKLRLQVERGELVPRLEVEQEMAGLVAIAARYFDTLPDVLERDCGATPAQLVKIEATLDVVREEMYQRLTDEDEDADSAAGQSA